MHIIFLSKNLKDRHYWKDLGVDGDVTIDLKEIGRECVDWIHLVQDRVQWRDLVKAVMYFRVP
jgi:hypothetical protein